MWKLQLIQHNQHGFFFGNSVIFCKMGRNLCMSRTRDVSSFVSRHVLVDLCERRALRRARELLVATNDAVRACNAVLSVLSSLAMF